MIANLALEQLQELRDKQNMDSGKIWFAREKVPDILKEIEGFGVCGKKTFQRGVLETFFNAAGNRNKS